MFIDEATSGFSHSLEYYISDDLIFACLPRGVMSTVHKVANQTL